MAIIWTERDLLRTANFAARKHSTQRRRDAARSPYIEHPLAVAGFLAEAGYPIETLMVGLLHDTVEDTETTIEELERTFSGVIASAVEELTHDKRLTRDARREVQVVGAAQMTVLASRVRIADKVSNVLDLLQRPPERWSQQERQDYLDFAVRVVHACRRPSTEAIFQLFHREITAARTVRPFGV